jgi:Tol biopolymer transport system component/predicted Ser/Thr protein kinase
MPLSAGDRLGPYEVLAPIGVGGMGEVYRATDTRLGRAVAIKIAATQFGARFEREARAISALNHPHICTLYDVGPNYLVMELVEGPTLAERIKKGAIPVEDALAIARQIADALDAAHEKGITHRDLKPGNVKIKPDGTVKVLDFGVAKIGGTPAPDAENSSTLTMTEEGVIRGTASYMSPEQAQGKQVDRRADIYAFGAVLYEMLTGERLHPGKTTTEILASVIRDETRWDRVPPQVHRLLRRCLEKDPQKRLRHIGDVMAFVDDAPSLAPVTTQPHGRWWTIIAPGLALVVLGALLWRATRPPDRPLVRLDVDLGSDVSLGSLLGADAILSPDGRRLAYVSHNRLLTRRLDEPKAAELPGTEGAYAPFFSPDGQWVAFFARSKLKKVSVEGGAAVNLCDASGGGAPGGSWGEDGNIVAALNAVGALSRIPSTGGMPTPVTELAPGEFTHRWPQILPGGKAVLFTTHTDVSGFDRANIEVMALPGRRRKTLVRGGTFGRYLPSGHLVYINRGTLFAVPFDLDNLAVRGTPAPLLDQIAYSANSGSAQLDFSRSGTLVYRSGGAGGKVVTVQWLDNAGQTQPLLTKPGFYQRPRVSPDGQRLALEVTEGSDSEVWIYEWQRDTMTRLNFGGGGSGALGNRFPVWSPDGRYIVFSAPSTMFWTRSDGAGKPQPLAQSKNLQVPWSFTADGKRLAFYEAPPGSEFDIWTVPIESDGAGLRAGKPEVFLKTSSDQRHSSFSPDGRWLAYASDESGAYQVYVRAFPDKGGKWQISNSGGVYPIWSRNGRELFFRSDDNRIMVANYTVKGDSFAAAKPRLWSDKKLADFGVVGTSNYDLAPDGKRIAAIMPAEEQEDQKAQNHVIFLENLFDELRRRAPTGK